MLNQRPICDDHFYKWRLVVCHPGAAAHGRIASYVTYQDLFTDLPEKALIICVEKEAKRLARKSNKFWSRQGDFQVIPELFNPKTLKSIDPVYLRIPTRFHPA